MNLIEHFLILGTFVTSSTYPQLIQALADTHPNVALIYAAKFLIAFPFSYHFANGVRHLVSICYSSNQTYTPIGSSLFLFQISFSLSCIFLSYIFLIPIPTFLSCD